MSMIKKELAKGVFARFIPNGRFHTTLISFNFYTPIARDTASENALLLSLLSTCGSQFPDFSKLNFELNRLYGAELQSGVFKAGDCMQLRLCVSVIDDAFALEGESVVKQAVRLLLSLIFEPKIENGSFCQEDIARERKKLLDQIKSEINDKRTFARGRLVEEMFRDEEYGVSRCGTEEQVNAITGEQLARAWRRLLTSAAVTVQVVGAAVPDGLWEEIEERFSRIDRRDVTDPTVCRPAEPADAPREVCDRMELSQGKLVMGFTTALSGDDDKALPLLLAGDIFGGGPYSKLFANVREKMSLCYYCSASSNRKKGFLTVDSGVEAENAEKAKEEILNQLRSVQNGDISDFEFESSVKSICDSLKTYEDSQTSLDMWYSTKEVNATVYSPEEIAEKVRLISREQVIEAARGMRLHTVYRLLPEQTSEEDAQ